jgi:hypothetical protein
MSVTFNSRVNQPQYSQPTQNNPPMAAPLSETQSIPTGYPTQDTFQPSAQPASPTAAAPAKKKKKRGFLKQLFESVIKPMLSQLIPGLGQLLGGASSSSSS